MNLKRRRILYRRCKRDDCKRKDYPLAPNDFFDISNDACVDFEICKNCHKRIISTQENIFILNQFKGISIRDMSLKSKIIQKKLKFLLYESQIFLSSNELNKLCNIYGYDISTLEAFRLADDIDPALILKDIFETDFKLDNKETLTKIGFSIKNHKKRINLNRVEFCKACNVKANRMRLLEVGKLRRYCLDLAKTLLYLNAGINTLLSTNSA